MPRGSPPCGHPACLLRLAQRQLRQLKRSVCSLRKLLLTICCIRISAGCLFYKPTTRRTQKQTRPPCLTQTVNSYLSFFQAQRAWRGSPVASALWTPSLSEQPRPETQLQLEAKLQLTMSVSAPAVSVTNQPEQRQRHNRRIQPLCLTETVKS